MDVDGVLTDGKLYHCFDSRDRFIELKGVDTQDGIGLAWLSQAGVETGIISGRRSRGLAERAKILNMRHVVQGTLEKVPAFERILKKRGLKAEEAAFIGDDLTDAPVMRRAGWAVAPANARPEVKRISHTVTKARGGSGAVREAAETLLKAKGLWKKILKGYEL
jgi:3-deoxy-D-manno-octulosonate 8-phosphate phosphatase (KDO 8-P phosphatase)